MSLGNGNILVQRKDQNSGGTLTGADNGLNVSGTTVKAGGPLTQNTDIDTSNFLYYIGSIYSYLMINVNDDVFYFGKCNNDLSLRSGYYFDTDEAGLKYENQKGLKIYSDSVVPNGTIVSEIGDIDAGHNGTKIKITDSTETVEITNIPNVDFTNMPVLFLDGNKLVKGNKANFGWQNFDIEISDATNTSGETQEFAKFSIINNTCFFSFSISFLVSDDSQKVTFSISLSDIETIAGITFDNFDNFAFSSAYNIPITPYPINYINAAGNGAGGVAITISPATVSGSEISSNVIQITGFAPITTV